MLASCLTIDPAQRITLDEILQHPWYKRYVQILPGTLATLIALAAIDLHRSPILVWWQSG